MSTASLKQRQQQMASWLLEGDPPSDELSPVFSERIGVYQGLVGNTLEEVLSNIYPFCKKWLKTVWPQVVQAFIQQVPTQHYALYKAVEGFPEFLEALPVSIADVLGDTAWMVSSLAQYEWLEVAVSHAKDPSFPVGMQAKIPQTVEELEQFIPVWNPVRVLFSAPIDVILLQKMLKNVQKTGDFDQKPFKIDLKTIKKDTFVMVYRDTISQKTRFLLLNPFTHAWFLQVAAQEKSVAPYINYVACYEYEVKANEDNSFNQNYVTCYAFLKGLHQTLPALCSLPESVVMAEGLKFLATCFESGVLLGTLGA